MKMKPASTIKPINPNTAVSSELNSQLNIAKIADRLNGITRKNM